MKNFFFQFMVLAFSLGSFGCYAKDIETGKMVSAFLEATGSEKLYLDKEQISFQDNEILFLNEVGQWMPTSFVGKDDHGLFINNFRGKPCPECNCLMYDGMCMNTNCKRYMK